MNKRKINFALAFLISLIAPNCFAITCSFTSTTAVVFGNYDVFSAANDDSIGSINYSCQGVGNNVIIIYLNQGNAISTFNRYMLSGASRLRYNLYLDSARTQVWGNGTSRTNIYGPFNPPNKTNVTVSVYGRIVAQQDAAVGSYSDYVVATVNF